jgi:hypothetical protein
MIVTPDPSADAQDGFALAAITPPAGPLGVLDATTPPAGPLGVLDVVDPHPATAAATAAIAAHTASPLCLFTRSLPKSAQRR